MKRAAWLHWIGKPYDNVVEFLEEARKQSILLEISLKDLNGLSWNDLVYCIIKRKGNKAGSVFCTFPVTRVYGVSQETADLTRERFECNQVRSGGAFVHREGGKQLEGAAWRVNANIQDLCSVIAFAVAETIETGPFFVGCYNDEFETLGLPWPRLSQVPKVRGFREFDERAFLADTDNAEITVVGMENAILLNSQYAAETSKTGELPGDLQWVNHYDKLDESKSPQMNLSLF